MKKDSLRLSTFQTLITTSKVHSLQLFIIAQLNEAESLRDVSKRTKDQEEIQTFIDIDSISASQLSRKQSALSPGLFEKVFRHIVLEKIGRAHV